MEYFTIPAFFLLLVFSTISCSYDDKNVYEQSKKIVNENNACTLEDVLLLGEYTDRLYWLWTDSLFRYARVKLYVYENDDIYNEMKIKKVNFQDSFFVYNSIREFIKNSTSMLKKAKALEPYLKKHVPDKPIQFFQNKSLNELINIYISEKNNLIKAYAKYEMFDMFRDVANSKYFYYKSLAEINSSTTTTSIVKQRKDASEKKKLFTKGINDAENKTDTLKNVIVFDELTIPEMDKQQFDYYDLKDKTGVIQSDAQRKAEP